jgi:hypothetical protein
MKKALVALALALVGSASQAVVQAVDPDKNGSFNAFLDAPNGLMWSSGYAFAEFGLTFKDASNVVGASTLEGFSDWRLPTMSEFLKLYATQGVTYITASQTAGYMSDYPSDPHRLGYWGSMFWTSDLVTSNAAAISYYKVFLPHSLPDAQAKVRDATLLGGVWAVRTVSPVPEPETYAMLLSGLACIALIARRRKTTGV